MSQLQQRIDQFRKMTQDDPEEVLGHYRLGSCLMEAGQYDEAVASFQRALQLSPDFAKVYQLLAQCYLQLGQRDKAVETLKKGHGVADEYGHFQPREEMAKMLTSLGEAVPASKRAGATPEASGGFRCQRPGCMWGARAKQLDRPPMGDELGKRIYESICAACWQEWLRGSSIKVINELRLDLSTERGQEEYDRYLREFMGFE